MFFYFGVLIGILFLLYSYYSFLLLLLGFEIFMLFIFVLMCFKVSFGGFTIGVVLLFSFFMVMEAVLGLSLLLSNYRFFGINFFHLW